MATQFNYTTHGYLAHSICCKLLPLEVLKSNAGFYIGTSDEGMPCSRESNYYASHEAASLALTNGTFTQRNNP